MVAVVGSDFLINHLHFLIESGNRLGTVFQPFPETLRHIAMSFISELMLKTGPEIHGNGANLDFNRNGLGSLGQKDGHQYNQVEAAVAIFLRLIDLIIFTDQGNVILTY